MKLRPLLAGVLFGLLGFAGNRLKVELFFNLDFLFGSSFAVFALLRFGPAAGIVAGVLASTCTLLLWNHPWAIVVFSAEAVFVSLLSSRRRLEPLGATLAFWLLPGPLLGWAVYHGVLGMGHETALLVLLKAGVNGVFNALLAQCVHLGIADFRPAEEARPGYREFVSTAILALLLFPALAYLVYDVRDLTEEKLEGVQRQTSRTARIAGATAERWINANHQMVASLAATLSALELRSGAEMQRHTDAFLGASKTFRYLGVIDRNAVSVAFSPARDPSGRPTAGRDFSDRPYLAVVRDGRQPCVGDVLPGRFDPAPVLPLLVPILEKSTYRGYCAGVLDLAHLHGLLDELVDRRPLVLTLLDRNGAVIESTDPSRRILAPLRRPPGEVRRVSGDVACWVPTAQAGTAAMQRWRSSYYFSESRLSSAIGWSVVAETPLTQALTDVSRTATRGLSALAGLAVFLYAAALFVSRRQARVITALHRLTEQVALDPGQPPDAIWPTSAIREVDALSRNFRHMAGTLYMAMRGLRGLNEELEERVALRTAELQAANRALRESEEHFRGLFEKVKVVSLVIDPEDGSIVDANPAAAAFYGWSRDELRAMKISEINALPPEKIRLEMDAAASEARSHFRFPHRLADGSVRDVEVYSGPVPTGGRALLYSIVHDVTERTQAEEALRELNRTLAQRVRHETARAVEKERLLVQQSKMAAMGEMIASIAHQWRQPLNAVGVIAQDIREAFEAGHLEASYLRRAVDDTMAQVRFMSKTVEDFRNFFRPDKAKTRFDLKRAVAEVCEMTAAQLRENRITWSITCSVHGKTFGPQEPVELCEAMEVSGFENEVKQVFLNLVSNAKDAILERRKTTGDDDAEGWIHVDLGRRDERVAVCVSDNGGGIPEALLDRIFEPYFTTKEQGKGTGIGLYMAKMIIENSMGGTISARNQGSGAEFCIVL